MCDCDYGTNVETCPDKYVQYGTEFWLKNGKDHFNEETCHDCGISTKGESFHHTNCDNERCPKCGGQMLSCGCCWDFCDESCGDWESNGCEKSHAGSTHKTLPNGVTAHKPTMISVKLYDCPDCDEKMAIKRGKPIIKDDVKVQTYVGINKCENIYYEPVAGYSEEDE